jgi:hypothetical protein
MPWNKMLRLLWHLLANLKYYYAEKNSICVHYLNF